MAQILKKGICQLCPTGSKEKPLISGLCTGHYWQSLRNSANLNYIQNRSDILPGMPQWYSFQIEQSDWICENCGAPIPHFNSEAQYSAQAHVLPKHLFLSVATHPDNRLHLGNFYGCDCHTRYDNNGYYAQSPTEMPILPVALARFDKFKHLIQPTELRHLTHLFNLQYNCNYGRKEEIGI